MTSDRGTYQRIQPLPRDFSVPEANAVDALGQAWGNQVRELKDSRALADFNEQLYRRWAIETGILERLYTIDRGITRVLVERGLDIALIEHGSTDRPAEEVVTILRDHRDAVTYVMDFVAGNNPLSLHFVRSLHQRLTAHQDSVEALDQFGRPLTVALLHGDWKKQPNNPTRPDGVVHAYCPPLLVPDEMAALLAIYQELLDRNTPTCIASAWLHHRFTQIHPFQDGNGRVARALAAFAFIRRGLFPIVIDRDDRSHYIDCLEAADDGDLAGLVRLWCRLQTQEIERALSLSESVLTAASPALRGRLLEAFTERARQSKEQLAAEQAKALQLADRAFDAEIGTAVEELRGQIETALEQTGSDLVCGVDFSTAESRHWFKIQLVEIAREYEYYCDLTRFHRWARLKLRHRDAPDEPTAEIVLSLHGLGRNFSGVMALSGYFAEREQDGDGRRISGPPRMIAERPLSFAYTETYEDIARRIAEWTEMALNVGLEEFRRVLF